MPWEPRIPYEPPPARWYMKLEAIWERRRLARQLIEAQNLPFEKLSSHQKLDRLTSQALDAVREELGLPFEPGNIKERKMRLEAALRILATQVRVDRNMITAQKTDRIEEILRRLQAGPATPGPAQRLLEG